MLEGYDCPADASGAALLLDDLCTALAGGAADYLFLDDFHLLRDEQAAAVPLCRLANRLPGNAHLVVASRNRFPAPGRRSSAWGSGSTGWGPTSLRLNRERVIRPTSAAAAWS